MNVLYRFASCRRNDRQWVSAGARSLTVLLLAQGSMFMGSVFMSSLFIDGDAHAAPALSMPYAQAGLTPQQAAAVLLDRFSYGPQPGQQEQLVKQGLERWFEQQLAAQQSEIELGTRLAQYPALGMTHQQLFAKFPSGAQGTAQARRFYDLVPPADAAVDNAWSNRKLEKFRKEQGYQSQETELYQQLSGQKLMRAIYAHNQLNEVLTDFWHNHFYTSSSNFRARPWVLAYESEAIRPNALGTFRQLLGAVAKHPAKVQATLGDAQKASINEADTTMGLAFAKLEQQGQQTSIAAIKQQLQKIATEEDLLLQKRFWPDTGPNLEYTRLLLQQTVGSKAYGKSDLQEAARVFTGWSTLPYGVSEQWFQGGFAVASVAGFVQQDSFVFRADRHDAKPKQVLSVRFAAGGGYEEGEQLLDALAVSPATAQNIAAALAEQFVGAQPSKSLINSLASSFRATQGDVRAMLRTLVQSKEFWRQAAAHDKVKSPFEYAVSALRTTQAEVNDTQALAQWIADMGQPVYAYLDANGVPLDKQWISSGSLIARMNFALGLSSGQIKGISLAAATINESLAMHIASPEFQLR